MPAFLVILEKRQLSWSTCRGQGPVRATGTSHISPPCVLPAGRSLNASSSVTCLDGGRLVSLPFCHRRVKPISADNSSRHLLAAGECGECPCGLASAGETGNAEVLEKF